jgi:hypothetical protein
MLRLVAVFLAVSLATIAAAQAWEKVSDREYISTGTGFLDQAVAQLSVACTQEEVHVSLTLWSHVDDPVFPDRFVFAAGDSTLQMKSIQKRADDPLTYFDFAGRDEGFLAGLIAEGGKFTLRGVRADSSETGQAVFDDATSLDEVRSLIKNCAVVTPPQDSPRQENEALSPEESQAQVLTPSSLLPEGVWGQTMYADFPSAEVHLQGSELGFLCDRELGKIHFRYRVPELASNLVGLDKIALVLTIDDKKLGTFDFTVFPLERTADIGFTGAAAIQVAELFQRAQRTIGVAVTEASPGTKFVAYNEVSFPARGSTAAIGSLLEMCR